MPENNICLLRVNIHDKYREKHVWSKCGRKHGARSNRPQSKILSHSSLRHICGRVVDFFRKLKFIVAYYSNALWQTTSPNQPNDQLGDIMFICCKSLLSSEPCLRIELCRFLTQLELQNIVLTNTSKGLTSSHFLSTMYVDR